MDVETEDEFSTLGLTGKNTLDIVAFNEIHFLAS